VVGLFAGQPGRIFQPVKLRCIPIHNRLRMALEDTTSIKVFELMPPLVDTEFSKEIGGSSGISPNR